MTSNQKEMLAEIVDGENPICLHVLGQSLVDSLSQICREQALTIRELESRIIQLEHERESK